MKVLKFGGTSVGSAHSLNHVKEIVAACPQQVIVVVSALGGVTNQLIEMTRMAQAHDSNYEAMLEQVKIRHHDLIGQVVPEQRQHECRQVIDTFIDEGLASFYSLLYANDELAPDFIDRLSDAIVCHGEIMSSAIVTAMIDDAMPHFSPNFIKTMDTDTQRVLDAETTERLIREEFAHRTERVHVAQGFIAADVETGEKTNLGRGGSDFTAALIAAALDAECLEIWTDVDGFMTADPRTDPTATVIPSMTYAEAQRMCDAGAKVIYPPTIAPVALKHIPVWVKNTFNPTAPGTVIEDD
ncbi:MAG: aspartate kinase [Muribaculaceae bacterium]|nr:aspartate kinase [Muribaculaceae bacterium]